MFDNVIRNVEHCSRCLDVAVNKMLMISLFSYPFPFQIKAYERALVGHIGNTTPARRLVSAIVTGINDGQTAAEVIQAETSDELKAVASIAGKLEEIFFLILILIVRFFRIIS